MPVDEHRAPVDLQQTLGGSSARTVPSRASFAAVPAARSAGSASAARRGRSAPPAAGGAAGGALSPERPLRGGGSSLTGPASCLAPAQRPWSPRCRAPSGGAPGETGPPVPPGHCPAASRSGCSAPPGPLQVAPVLLRAQPGVAHPYHPAQLPLQVAVGYLQVGGPGTVTEAGRGGQQVHGRSPHHLAFGAKCEGPRPWQLCDPLRKPPAPPFPTSTGPQPRLLEVPQMRQSGVLAHLLSGYDLLYGRPDAVRAFPRHRS